MAGVTVLVVDDDPVIVQLLRVNFEMEGFVVLTAGDGDDGLRQIRNGKPDVVVCDIMMPKLDGWQVREAFRLDSATSRLPFILRSAKVQGADVRRGLDQGADDYITKPFDPFQLVERVHHVLARARAGGGSHPRR